MSDSDEPALTSQLVTNESGDPLGSRSSHSMHAQSKAPCVAVTNVQCFLSLGNCSKLTEARSPKTAREVNGTSFGDGCLPPVYPHLYPDAFGCFHVIRCLSAPIALVSYSVIEIELSCRHSVSCPDLIRCETITMIRHLRRHLPERCALSFVRRCRLSKTINKSQTLTGENFVVRLERLLG